MIVADSMQILTGMRKNQFGICFASDWLNINEIVNN